jgi:hypothetical protein
MVITSGQIRLRAAVLASLIVIGMSLPAHAQSFIALNGGASIDPKQVYAGVAWESPDIGGRIRFRPGLDGGFGDGLRLGTANIDIVAAFKLGTTHWTLIQGGGPVITFFRYSDVENSPTEVHAGGSYLFEMRHDKGFFAEFRLGGGGSYTPNLKFGAGWAFEIK